MATDPTQLLLRIPSELKAELQREANFQGRKLTQEINIRLRNSLLTDKAPTLAQYRATKQAGHAGTTPYPTSTTQVHHTNNVNPEPNDKGPANALTDIDRAMLDVFHTLPPEKQLALLSLFR